MTERAPERVRRLVNGKGIAMRAGVTPAAVANWPARYSDFPKPLEVPGVVGIPLWDWRDIERWLKAHGRA